MDKFVWFEKNKFWFYKNCHVSFENKDKNYAISSNWTDVDFSEEVDSGWIYTDDKEIDTVYCGINDNTFYIWKYDAINYKNTRLLNTFQKFNFQEDPFILFTGHTGSGTSIVVKFLRHLGVHFGDDCGNIQIRKPMESSSLRCWWWFIESNHTINEKRQSFQSILGSYNYKSNKINAVKLLNDKPTNQVLKFGNIIPKTKIVSIIKKPKPTENTTIEGTTFNKKSRMDINKIQYPTVEGNPIFHLDWNRFFTEYEYCNKLLSYINLDFKFDNAEEFRIFTIDKVGFKPEYL
tara:strand:+ start:198 stop:1070 length:873 start_codon:yes stop_codon:yes gene_type:complete